MKNAALAAGAHIVQAVFHQFAPQGVSGVVVVEESHISVHTWPEAGYAAVDFYTCGETDPAKAHAVLVEGLGATSGELMRVQRGNLDGLMKTERLEWENPSPAFPVDIQPRNTLLPDPSHYFMVAGSSEGPTPLNAFDNALLAAGIGDTNLVRMSSILPPRVEIMEPRPLPPGALVPVAYAEMTSSNPGETIAAAVAIAFPQDESLPGLIMEHHAAASREEVEAEVRRMAVAGMEHRRRPIKDVVVRGAEHVVGTTGCAYAAVVLWHDK